MQIALVLMATLWFQQPVEPLSGDLFVEQTKNGAFIFKKYPARALAAGEQGDVEFRAAYNKHGYVLDCEVTRSSGYRLLDNETCEIVVRHARFKPALLNQGKARRGTLNGLFEWRIPGAGQPNAPKLADGGDRMPDKLICQRVLRTGSMVIYKKQCLTKREWEILSDEVKDTLGEAQRRASQRLQ